MGLRIDIRYRGWVARGYTVSRFDSCIRYSRASTPSQPVTTQKTPSRPPMKVTAHRSISSQPGEQVQYFFMHACDDKQGDQSDKV